MFGGKLSDALYVSRGKLQEALPWWISAAGLPSENETAERNKAIGDRLLRSSRKSPLSPIQR